MRIAVASGKGGTGKTTVAVNLFHFLRNYLDADVTLVDCDVEEPNAALFFSNKEIIDTRLVYQQIAKIDIEACTFCKRCAEWCAFNAITIVKSRNFAQVDEQICHSCGACLAACQADAISEKPQLLGQITSYNTGSGPTLTEGRLNVGSPMHSLLIKKLKKETTENSQVVLFDAPPGTGCPVLQTLSDTDYVVVVTEPTPFGLHDLKIIVEVIRQLKIPFGVVVNKSGLGSGDVYHFLNENSITLLGNIPFSKAFARKYSEGKLLTAVTAETENIYRGIIRKIMGST